MNRKSKFKNSIYAVVLSGVFAITCWGCIGGEKDAAPDVSDISSFCANAALRKRILFALDTSNITAKIARLEQKYPVFLPFFIRGIA